tara:strand:- start:1956 stop:2186 length:231 start_codon:yes stop_codon:yes gene_type:complete
MKKLNRIINTPFLLIIFLYQKIFSPILGPKCRFSPTCSNYAKEAIIKYGPFKGLLLGITRISKCHPWGGKGYDPVP